MQKFMVISSFSLPGDESYALSGNHSTGIQNRNYSDSLHELDTQHPAGVFALTPFPCSSVCVS